MKLMNVGMSLNLLAGAIDSRQFSSRGIAKSHDALQIC